MDANMATLLRMKNNAVGSGCGSMFGWRKLKFANVCLIAQLVLSVIVLKLRKSKIANAPTSNITSVKNILFIHIPITPPFGFSYSAVT